jgi:hypothetical protein
LIKSLRTASARAGNFALAMLLQIAADRLEELVDTYTGV